MAKAIPLSPLAPTRFPDIETNDGVRLATAKAGIKYQERTDVLLAAFDPGTVVAGVFTRSKCRGAPVDWCRNALRHGVARGLVVNTGMPALPLTLLSWWNVRPRRTSWTPWLRTHFLRSG